MTHTPWGMAVSYLDDGARDHSKGGSSHGASDAQREPVHLSTLDTVT